MPDALILGDVGKWNLDFYRLGPGKYMQRPSLKLISPEDALARKKLNKFFQEEIDLSPVLFFETDKMKGEVEDMEPEDFHDHTVYQDDPGLKRKIALPQMTAARIVCSHHNKKAFFGAPCPFLLLEEACARLTLKELEDIFYQSLEIYDQRQ